MAVQDSLFLKNILKSVEVKVKLPILASIGNCCNNWSAGHTTSHVEVKQNFLKELKEAGIVEFQWIFTASNEADMFTKHLAGLKHNNCAARLCGHDKYYSTMQDRESHEKKKVSGVVEHS